MEQRPYKLLLVAVEGGVCTLTLNRPERRNAIGAPMVNELLYALEDAHADSAVRSIVITGAGQAFCAGGDFSQMTGGDDDGAMPPKGDYKDLLLALWRSEKPIIARVNGHAMGGGLGVVAACTFAIGASYAGKCAVTITSGPGLSLKQEAIGLAVMAEIPLVVIDVQRGGPSTGLPTKVEQGDLMSAIFGGHGDAPKVVMAASTIEDCFYSVITARKIAETFNMVVVILSDAALSTAQQPFPRPKFNADWLAPPVDQSAVPLESRPYDWDERTGIMTRFIPGQPNGMHCLTGLAHDRGSHVAYDPEINEEGLLNRSRKLAALQTTLRLAPVFGDDEGDLLLIGWGSTKGAIEEAVTRLRARGRRVSSLHLKFLQPMASGIDTVMRRFAKVMTIENNWNDPPDDPLITPDNRRYSSVAMLLRARWLVDVDCWGKARGQPLKPGAIEQAALAKLDKA